MKGKGKKAKVTSMKGKGGTFRHRVQETEEEEVEGGDTAP